jgi:hypothetical protein
LIDIRPYIRPSDHGDTTPALDAAVAAAMPKAESVFIPAGWHLFNTRPKPIGGGVTIRGESGWTSAHTGTCLVARYNEPDNEAGFLTWDGTDARGYKGTGGGVRDLTIYKYGDFKGGCAIVVKPENSTDHRSGMWNLENVAVISENGGLWDRIVLMDGSNIPKGYLGGMGVRCCTIKSLFASGANVCNVEFRNAVHVDWFGGQVQQGPAPVATRASVKITGVDTQDVKIVGVSIYGLLHLEHCKYVDFGGLAVFVRIDEGVSCSFVKAMQCTDLVNNTRPSDKVMVTTV